MNNPAMLVEFRNNQTPDITTIEQFKKAIFPLISLGFFEYQNRSRNLFIDVKETDRHDRSMGCIIKSDYLIALSNTLAPLCETFQGFKQPNCVLHYSTNWQEAFFKVHISLNLKAYNPHSPQELEDASFLQLSYNLLSFFQYHYGWSLTRLPSEYSSHCYATMNHLILRPGEYCYEETLKPIDDLLLVSCLKEIPYIKQSFEHRMQTVLKNWVQRNDIALAKAIGEQMNCGTTRRKFINDSFYADQNITA